MRLSKMISVLAAFAAGTIATSASATTYNLGTLPNNVRVFLNHDLSDTNPNDTYVFKIGLIGDLGNRLFHIGMSSIPGLTAKFYSGVVGSGTLLKTFGEHNYGMAVPNVTPGNYYAVVSSNALSAPRQYQLQLYAEGTPAPAPGPAGFLVFAAGAAAMGYRKRRMKAMPTA